MRNQQNPLLAQQSAICAQSQQILMHSRGHATANRREPTLLVELSRLQANLYCPSDDSKDNRGSRFDGYPCSMERT